MKWFARQYIGTRETQQDSVRVGCTGNGLLAAVCDGMGSKPRAAESAEYAAESVVTRYGQLGECADITAFLREAVRDADEDIADLYDGTGGTTGVFVHLRGDRLNWLSVGDSRLYIFRGGVLTQLTRDHNYRSVLEQRLAAGGISRDYFDTECRRKGNALVSYIGMDGLYLADMNARPQALADGDIILVTTDGLYKALGDRYIAAVLSDSVSRGADISAAADGLIGAVMGIKDRRIDNTSFVLISMR